MLDNFNRKINYLRISVTDRCNLRCTYCMPEDGVSLLNHKDILSFEEIINIVKAGVKLGIDKIRLTGGEPLVRKGITELVSMIAKIEGVKDFGLTTNGVLLEKFAADLAEAGLHRINISLDTVNPEKFHQITRGGDIKQVFKGIDAAKNAGLLPVKINCIVNNSSDENDAKEVADFCDKNDLKIRYIHLMKLDEGDFSVIEGGEGGDCKNCNRLRVTANGILKPCLFDNAGINIREHDIEKAFLLATENKPECGTINNTNEFYNIGG